jgi:transcriptional regulator with XRE-family HTH domain
MTVEFERASGLYGGMQLGDRIRVLRELKGLTQKELGDRSGGITGGHIHKIEAGSVNNLKLDTIRAIADALGTTIDPLVYGDGIAKQAELRAIEDELLELGRRQDSEEVRRRLRELSARAAELSSGETYPPLRPSPDDHAKAPRRRGPKPGARKRKSTRPGR